MKIPIDIKTGNVGEKSNPDKKLIVGIDLGTTNSLIACIDESGNPFAIGNEIGRTLVPSIIYISEAGKVVVGEEAKSHLITDPERTIYSIKRLLGRSYKDFQEKGNHFAYNIIDNEDENSLVKIKIDDHFYNPIQLSSLILKELKHQAEKVLGQEINQAVITVPAYFNDTQRQATRDAGKLAGLDVLRIINEPTAASLAYGIGVNRDVKQKIAVFDLGGGTFDVSILELENGVFEVLATHGNTALGGDDIDKLVVHYLQNKYQFKVDSNDRGEAQRWRLLGDEAKRHLSKEPKFNSKIGNKDVALTIDEFNLLIQPIIDKTIHSCQLAMRDANLSLDQIDQVVMVGGSTRIPAIKSAVSSFFNKEVNDSMNPDEVVGLGAAIQADILAGNRKDIFLLDVTPLSLGIETLGGLMDVIIPRNNKVPFKAGRQYTTSLDGQKNLMINVYQGERDLVKYNRKLASFILKDIPAMPAGLPKIDINFLLDADGILTVKAKELRSNTETQIEVKSTYSISEEEMSLMLLDSIKNASSDMEQKAKLEAINEGKSLVLATEKFIKQNKDIFSQIEVEKLNQFSDALKLAIQSSQKSEIENAIQILNDYANPLAHRAMDNNIIKALKGEKV